MNSHCILVDDDDEIRQGDVITRLPTNSANDTVWGCVLTADCDIAQKKVRDYYTCLEIVPASYYIEKYWAAEQLHRLIEKHVPVAIQGIAGLTKSAGYDVTPLTPSSLRDWLSDKRGDDIVASISKPGTANARLVAVLNALRIALGHEGPISQLSRLRSAWALLGLREPSQQARIREAFDPDRGFPDFLLVPEIRECPGYGYVVLLRSLWTLAAKDLFRSELDARINDRPDAFHRIGRFNDTLRFAIAQKLAFLFSRIGMPIEYEQACESATDLLVETIFMSSSGAD